MLTCTLVTGTKEARSQSDALSANKRSKHDYTRTSNFDKVVKLYEKPENNLKVSENSKKREGNMRSENSKKDPKCKLSLNIRLLQDVDIEPLEIAGNVSSRSSLYSIPSIEWDGRCKSDYALRTRSLPRQKVSNPPKLFRTRSHGSFLNNYVKDPEPVHYHLPRCRSCGATNNSYIWEMAKERCSRNTKQQRSIYMSMDNIPQKCLEETPAELNLVKVKETSVPIFKIVKDDEFVESQEFNEDNYLEDLNSFSSENKTVIEQTSASKDFDKNDGSEDVNAVKICDNDFYRAEVAHVETEKTINDTIESTEGEYHSFTDEMDFEDAAYESPVKDLVEKDIRDYSVPINFYCDDYKKDGSPRKSPQKRRETPKGTVLEPILEESKSLDDSSIDKSTEKSSECVADSSHGEMLQEFKKEDDLCSEKKNEVVLSTDVVKQDCGVGYGVLSFGLPENVEIPQESNAEKETSDLEQLEVDTNNVCNALSFLHKIDTADRTNKDEVRISAFSDASSGNERSSFNSTVEFEKYEVIADILGSLLNKIEFENPKHDNFFNTIVERNFETQFDIENSIIVANREKNNNDDTKFDTLINDNNFDETFSITKIIADLEVNMNLNETVLTEISDSESVSHRIVGPILHYIFDRAYCICSDRNKIGKKRKAKKVVTVVDTEDILLTAKCLWPDIDYTEVNTEDAGAANNSEVDMKERQIDTVDVCEKMYTNPEFRMDTNEDGIDNIVGVNEGNVDINVSKDDPETCLSNENVTIENDRFSTDNKVKHSLDFTSNEDFIACIHSKITKGETINIEENLDVQEIIEMCDVLFDYSANETQFEECISRNISYNNETDENIQASSMCDAECDCGEKGSDVLNETFTLEEKELNTAFVESVDSNQNSKIVFDCTESPIKKSNSHFVGEDLSVLYENNDTLMGSPFVKKASVITMSQNEHTGGIKYWVSFDESLAEDKPVRVRRQKNYELPSFVSIDFNDSNDLDKKSPIIVETVTDNDYASSSHNFECKVLSGNVELNETFDSQSNTEYNSCEEIIDGHDSNQTMLLYDSRIDMNSKSRRMYSSWPPYEDTLFYRIISKFRMSESFDNSDLERAKIDSS